jgi:hypothetical protein
MRKGFHLKCIRMIRNHFPVSGIKGTGMNNVPVLDKEPGYSVHGTRERRRSEVTL